jgi:hypothetical protein
MAAEPRIACSVAYHEALKRSPAAWRHLELVGTQPDPEQPERLQLELRNCSCGSTLAIEFVHVGGRWCAVDESAMKP